MYRPTMCTCKWKCGICVYACVGVWVHACVCVCARVCVCVCDCDVNAPSILLMSYL